MACIIKVKDNLYIEYSKPADSISGPLSKSAVLKLLKESLKVKKMLNPNLKIKVEEETNKLFNFLETYGTTDLSKTVDLDFVLEFNGDSPKGRPLTLPEIIKKYTKKQS